MNLGGWLRLLSRNRWDIGWKYWHIALAIIFWAAFNTVWGWVQTLTYAHRLRGFRMQHAPIFILGHWRSGTTLLHELLVQDERHGYPSTWACLAPNHFLRSEYFAFRFLNFLIPKQRPMDNMPAGWRRPQEEEFAICNLGLPSPYLTIAFPNHPPQAPEYITMERVPPTELARWKAALLRFLTQVSFRTGKRMVLKSPPHTGRIKVLLEMFPDAKFVHIVRDPYVVFSSTINLWHELYSRYGLQTPTYEGLEDYVFDTFLEMYDAFERQRELIPPGRFCEVRYEDLVQDPIAGMRNIYSQLELGQFEEALPAMEEYLASTQGYRTNRYELPADLRDRITARWSRFIQQYGYDRGT